MPPIPIQDTTTARSLVRVLLTEGLTVPLGRTGVSCPALRPYLFNLVRMLAEGGRVATVGPSCSLHSGPGLNRPSILSGR